MHVLRRLGRFSILAAALVCLLPATRAQTQNGLKPGVARITIRYDVGIPLDIGVVAGREQIMGIVGPPLFLPEVGGLYGYREQIDPSSVTTGVGFVQFVEVIEGTTAEEADVEWAHAWRDAPFSVINISWAPGFLSGGLDGSGGSGGGNTPLPPDTPTISASSDKAKTIDQLLREGSKIGGPVDTGTGAESFSRRLFTLFGARQLDLVLAYSSAVAASSDDLGNGWYHPFLGRLTQNGDGTLTVIWSYARRSTYAPGGDGALHGVDLSTKFDRVTSQSNGDLIITKPDQTSYVFSSSVLTAVKDAHGRALNIVRTGGAIATITEPVSGVQLSFTYANGRISRISDPLGRAYSFSYDASANLTSIVDPAGGTTKYTYVSGRLATVTTPDGLVVYSNTYDTYGRVVTQDDGRADNGLMKFAYDETTRPGFVVTTVTKRDGARLVYTHDANLQLISVQNELGAVTAYEYDANGAMTKVTDPLGRVSLFTHDASGNVIKFTDPDGRQTFHDYDSRRNHILTTAPSGYSARFEYDARNNLTATVGFDGVRRTFDYDSNALRIRETSPQGGVTTITYQTGRCSSIKNQVGNTTTYAYDAAGRLTTITDPTGAVRQFSYAPGAADLVAVATDPLNHQASNFYDSRNRLVRTVDPLGAETKFTYDGNGNLLTRTDALSNVTSFTYDGEDRRIAVRDARGNTSTMQFDAAGLTTAMTNAEGGTIRFEYDAAGNTLRTYDPMGYPITTLTYNSLDLPLSMEDALGRTRKFIYDEMQRLSMTLAPGGRGEAFGFDPAGRPTIYTNGSPGGYFYTYDAEGNITKIAQYAKTIAQLEYDAAGRNTAMASGSGLRTTYAYEARDLLATLTSPSGAQTKLTYNPVGKIARQVDAAGTIDYGYDACGRSTTVTENGLVLTRTFDRLGRITAFHDTNGFTVTCGYDAVGNLTQLGYPGGQNLTYVYDKANRVVRIVDWANRETRYTYDADGRIVASIRPNGTSVQLVYDAAGQLAEYNYRDPAGKLFLAQRYTYDADGRLASEVTTPAVALPSVPVNTMTYDADNRLLTIGANAVQHDVDGNLTLLPFSSGATVSCHYDARHRLTDSTGSFSYTYDAENRRVARDLTTTHQVFVNNPLPDRFGPLLQTTITSATGTSVTSYVWGPDGLIYRDSNGLPLYYHFDIRGNTVASTSSPGQVTGRWVYGAYGDYQTTFGTDSSTFLFGGRQGVTGENNGLYFMRSRYYSSVARRFITPDRFGLRGGANVYAYADGAPSFKNDPKGQFADIFFEAAAGAAISVGSKVFSDVVRGHASGASEYLGAFVGGAVGGVVAAHAGPDAGIAAGAVTGAIVGNLVKQGAHAIGNLWEGKPVDDFNSVDLAVDVAVGGISGGLSSAAAPALKWAIGAPKLVGLSSGAGAWQQVSAQSLNTLAAGTAAPVSPALLMQFSTTKLFGTFADGATALVVDPVGEAAKSAYKESMGIAEPREK